MPDLLAQSASLKLLVQVLITAWMLYVSVIDHRTGRIPNAVTAPVFLGVGAYRLLDAVLGAPGARLAVVGLLMAWVLIFGLWMLNFIGGGDAKFLMGEYALFPSMEWTATLAFILLPITVLLLLVDWLPRLTRSSPSELKESLQGRLMTGALLPTREELEERGRRYAWTFAIPGIVYTWVYW